MKTAPSSKLTTIIQLPYDSKWFENIKSELLIPTLAVALRDVIKNSENVGFGRLLQFWMDRGSGSTNVGQYLMMECEEAYYLAVDTFTPFKQELSVFSPIPDIEIDILRYDMKNNDLVVSIQHERHHITY